MPRSRQLEYGVLNLSAHPHPARVYIESLRAVARTPVNFRGDDHAAILEPTEHGDGLYQGRIVIWTEVDPNSPTVHKRRLEEFPLDKAVLQFSEEFGIFSRTFIYVFRDRDHKLFFESRNNVGKRLSHNNAKRIFSLLFSDNLLGEISQIVTVEVQPEEDAVDKVLGIPRIGLLHIHISRPNPDDATLAAEEVLRELEEQGAISQDITLRAISREGGIHPNERTRAHAEIAAQGNGYVEAVGRSDNNTKIKRSTKEYPRTISSILTSTASSIEVTIAVAKNTFFGDSSE